MGEDPLARDYSLLGPEGPLAIERGLASAEWYKTPIDRKRMKELMKRSDGPATRHTLIWLAILIGTGVAGVVTWRSWWSLPIFFVYGTFYGSTADARWHETGHGTAFKTDWKNQAVYQIACFMLLREPEPRRWSHARHHTDTIIVGRDPEIITPRPPNVFGVLVDFFSLKSAPKEFTGIVRHALGRVSAEEATYIPESEQAKMAKVARIWLVIFAVVAVITVITRSWLPVLLIGGPKIYGAWFQLYVGLTQHVGLADDVLDYRLNTRTIYMNPLFRFMYWNMNYHVEHHMYPMVPYHNLPALHREIASDCPPAYHGTISVYREMVATLRQQLTDNSVVIHRTLPTALPPASA
jgi:fatty acid desaturase